MPNKVPGFGPSDARLVVVAEAPGEEEDERQEPMVGPTGREIQSMLSEAGISWGEVYRTNVHKYRPPDNKLYRYKELGIDEEAEREELWQEIREVNPNCILLLGALALKTVTGKTGITTWRGSILQTQRGMPKCVGTYHPAAYLTQRGEGGVPYRAKAYVKLDFKRAVEESLTRELTLPNHTIITARNSYDLHRFLDLYDGHKEVAVDIEVAKAIPTCIAFAFNKWHAVSVPLLNIKPFKDGYTVPDTELTNIWDTVAHFLEDTPGLRVIGQNFKFDQQKIIAPMGIRCPDPWVDTMILFHTLYPEFPKTLAFLTSICTRVPYYKDELGEFNFKKLPIEYLLEYNAKDVLVDHEVTSDLLPELKALGLESFFFDFMMKLHPLYMEIESHGLNVNKEKREVFLRKYLEWLEAEIGALRALIAHKWGNEKLFNPFSNPNVLKLLYHDLELPIRYKDGKPTAGEDALVGLLSNVIKEETPQYYAVDGIMKIRRIKKAVDLARVNVDFDGKVRTNERIDGTETGRTTNKMLRPPVRPWPMGMPFQTITKHGDFGADIREMFEPSPGHIFLNADLAQAETRIVAILSQDLETLELIDKLDLHRLTACWFFNYPEENIASVTKEERFVGKTGRHMGDYDSGPRRMMQEIQNGARRFHIDVKVSESRARQILYTFHQRTPKIRMVFHRDIRDTLSSSNRVLTNPFGRRRQFFDRWGDDLWREAYAYIPQSTVGDALKHAMLRIRNRLPIKIVIEAHDSILCDIPRGHVEEWAGIIREEMEKPIDFSSCSLPRGILKIPCDIEIGENYKDLKKVKRA